ncbi:alpha/beta hydrolase [Microbacterium sp. UBA3394]|uniref:alpha/beta hydrolase n=1 Tax=Microbacterium sp. UBA3394 TaxID=1946945 RepID=UPI00257E656F|nr:alpha/beta hydrolase [Microbacterium sp. UBA3394]
MNKKAGIISTQRIRPARRRRVLVAASIAVVGALVTTTVAGCSWAPSDTDSPTPDVAQLAGALAEQELAWEECEFEAPPVPGADVSNVECATIKVPRDWHNPDPGQTWDVRISFAENIDRSDPEYHTTILTHPGGPVTPGLSYSATVQSYTPELRPTTNYVSFDQRGLGQSSHAECNYEYDPADGLAASSKAIAESCAEDPDVRTMTTEQAAYDMDFIRHLLGLETVTYVGYSYGTWLGTWFGALFSDHIDRMLFDSASDSTADSIQANYDAAHEGRDRQFRLHMMNWIARNDATYGLGADPKAIWDRYFDTTSEAKMATAANWAWTSTNVNLAFSNPVAYPYAGELVGRIIEAGEEADGELDSVQLASGIIDKMTTLTDEQRAAAHSLLAALSAPPAVEPDGMIRATHDFLIDFTKCTDGEWEQGDEYWEDFNDRTSEIAPLSAQLGLLDAPQPCAFWPTESEMPPLNDSFPETLVVQSELDSMTPFEQGHSAGLNLPNTSLIAVDNESVHGVFPYFTEEVDGPVLDFLLGGPRPDRTIVAAAKPMPLEEITYETWTPLDSEGQHGAETPYFTDPNIPARSGTPRVNPNQATEPSEQE